jgi:hypothetical protein
MHAAYADPVAAISLEMPRYAKKLLRTKTRSRLLKTLLIFATGLPTSTWPFS